MNTALCILSQVLACQIDDFSIRIEVFMIYHTLFLQDISRENNRDQLGLELLGIRQAQLGERLERELPNI